MTKIADELLADMKKNNKRIPGFGHRQHATDPRTVKLFEIAKKNNFTGKHIELAKALETKLTAASSKKLPINVDGAIGAVMSDMGFDYRIGKGFFIVSRCAGLIAQAYEEITRYKPMRKFSTADYEYDGPANRQIG